MLTQSVLIACGGFLGALACFTLSRWFAQRGTVFPLGTLLVNPDRFSIIRDPF